MASEDSELWAVATTHWVIPIYVTWKDDLVGEIEPAVPLLRIQSAALALTLGSKIWQANGKTWIERSVISDVAIRLGNVDPEHVLVWLAPYDPVVDDPVKDEDEWIRYIRKSGFWATDATARIYWQVVIKCMITWLFVEERELDLQFCKMRLSALRTDWKHVITTHLKVGLTTELGDRAVIKSICNYLLMPEMISYKMAQGQSPTVNWTLDVSRTSLWDRNVNEKNRQFKGNPKRYWTEAFHFIRSHLMQCYESYLDYANQMDQAAGPTYSRVLEVSSLLSDARRKLCLALDESARRESIRLADVAASISSGPENLDEEAQGLREVPDI